MIDWKVVVSTTLDLQARLNELALEDYDIYRLECYAHGENSSGLKPLMTGNPSQVVINQAGYTPPTNMSPTVSSYPTISQGSFTSNMTRTMQWVIVACKYEQ